MAIFSARSESNCTSVKKGVEICALRRQDGANPSQATTGESTALQGPLRNVLGQSCATFWLSPVLPVVLPTACGGAWPESPSGRAGPELYSPGLAADLANPGAPMESGSGLRKLGDCYVMPLLREVHAAEEGLETGVGAQVITRDSKCNLPPTFSAFPLTSGSFEQHNPSHTSL